MRVEATTKSAFIFGIWTAVWFSVLLPVLEPFVNQIGWGRFGLVVIMILVFSPGILFVVGTKNMEKVTTQFSREYWREQGRFGIRACVWFVTLAAIGFPLSYLVKFN